MDINNEINMLLKWILSFFTISLIYGFIAALHSADSITLDLINFYALYNIRHESLMILLPATLFTVWLEWEKVSGYLKVKSD